MIRCCKRCERELCQPYCERCGVWTKTEAEEQAEADLVHAVDCICQQCDPRAVYR